MATLSGGFKNRDGGPRSHHCEWCIRCRVPFHRECRDDRGSGHTGLALNPGSNVHNRESDRSRSTHGSLPTRVVRGKPHVLHEHGHTPRQSVDVHRAGHLRRVGPTCRHVRRGDTEWRVHSEPSQLGRHHVRPGSSGEPGLSLATQSLHRPYRRSRGFPQDSRRRIKLRALQARSAPAADRRRFESMVLRPQPQQHF